MFGSPKISPSILSADPFAYGRDVSALAEAGADWVHVDVMDGHFVPNITMGVPLAKSLGTQTDLPADVHLMVSNPLQQAPWFLACAPYVLTAHFEAFDDARKDCAAFAALVHDAGVLAGLSVKPDTPIDSIVPYVGLFDMFLVMSVYPGFSGQSFIPESIERIARLAKACTEAGVNPLIQVDGGIDAHTAPSVAAAGADVLVAGSAVFGADNLADAISGIRQAASQGSGASDGR